MRTATLIALLIIPLGGCAIFGGGSEAEPVLAEQPPAQIRPSSALLEPIEIRASARGNGVRFTLINNHIDELYIGPENFALVSPRHDEPLLATSEGVLVRFQPSVLHPGDSFVGEIIFLNRLDIVGHRLIYNTTQAEQRFWMAEIQSAD